ncbi:hypothetical protein Pan216_21130 [Planctomycetes bacterium Pan216]|uniref:dATP/dGTP diphosphohydrolase N-terminal domain-containing protein n=1 Tax=Kolteria novifilia TaxID=2527975 RepID=A0A518B2P1_9BACT|nr:hypothetical protein Pan216_21130 [Planctomycetes bacterium Pan216]
MPIDVDLSPNAPITENEQGRKQSAIDVRFDLLPAHSLFAIAGVLHRGALKYGEGNWKGIATDDHLNHALTHVFAYLAGDTQDDHLGHAACRMLMAHEMALTGEVE